MNPELTSVIIKHIFSNLGIQNKNLKNSYNLISNDFKLTAQLNFEEIKTNVYGCSGTFSDKTIKILAVDCTEDSEFPEFAVIISLQDSPMYGLYTIYNVNYLENEPLIAANVNNQWIYCNTYLQATFLAGLEQIKDFVLTWEKCQEYSEQLEKLKSFIQYYENFYSDQN